jgi:hypothetical protein
MVVVKRHRETLVSSDVFKRIVPDESEVAFRRRHKFLKVFDPFSNCGKVGFEPHFLPKVIIQHSFQVLTCRAAKQFGPSRLDFANVNGIANCDNGNQKHCDK